MNDVTQRLERIEARLAIAELAARYAVAVDSRNLDAIAALFVEDVAVGGGQTGHEALKTQFRGILQSFYRTFHHLGGMVLEFDGPDHANGTVYCRAEHEAGGRWVTVPLCYFDKYERRDGRWLFVSRRLRTFYHADLAKGPVPPYDVFPGRDAPDSRTRLPQWWPSWGEFWDAAPPGAVERLTEQP
jgi:ketosteroid isomerase-like protein